jgi:nicotinate-nucleotide adenylyltransferase
MPKRMVLFGGTFDPVHNGHLIVARCIREALGQETITLAPAASPPHKAPAVASASERLDMLRLATEGEAGFEICTLELERVGPSYTLETLRQLRRQHGRDTEIDLVVGADMLEDLPRWHRVGEVLGEASLVVAGRRPQHERMPEILAEVAGKLGLKDSQRLERAIVETPLIDISSTDIRRRVRQGLSIQYLVPEAVAKYIESNKLYRQ